MDILSFALGYKKGKSTGGGGGTSGDERVKYVTFMYGEVELLKYPVISGDTCHDPVADGLIDTPTKEQTVSTVYTYSGWALTDGGAASSSALANVTEDRTVYVAFAESARMYTINFYDGETLLKSEQVAYGETPKYTPTKDGYEFTEWTPKVIAVVGDADYYAQWVSIYGFSYLNTITPTNSFNEFAVSNRGAAIAVCERGAATAAVLYTGGGTRLPMPISSTVNFSSCDCSFDDSNFYMKGSSSGGYKLYSIALSSTNGLPVSSGQISSASGYAKTRCSPVSSLFGEVAFSSKNGYYIKFSSGTSSDYFGKSFAVEDFCFSPDGEHVAVASESSSSPGARVYSISTGAIVTTLSSYSCGKVSYNKDGSRLVYCSSGTAHVVETDAYTEICSIDKVALAEFLGYDCLVTSYGAAINVYTVTEDGYKNFEYDVPTYSGGSITKMRKNHEGTRVLFGSDTAIEIWKKG